ncbi:MFS transporter [Actinomycetes bacterium KLBMP 9759]
MTTSVAPHTVRTDRPTVVVAVLACAGIMVALMQTLIVPIVGRLPALLRATPIDASWVLTATLLTGAVATPVAGRLGDMYGKRRVLLASLALMVVGSVVCGLSQELVPMVVGRALQGGAVGVIPLGISIMRDVLPAERLGSAMAVMSSSLGVGGALGLPGAALVAESMDWHMLFWISAGLGVLLAGLVAVVVAESPVRTGGRFDGVGALGLAVGLCCLLLPVTKGAQWGWTSGATLGLLAAAAAVLLAWAWWELRIAEPVVDLRTSGRRPVLLTNLASVALGFAMYSMSLVVPQLLQLPTATGHGLGQSLLVAGLCLAPGGLVMMAISRPAARLSAVRGPKVSLMAGAAVIAVGYGLGVLATGSVLGLVVISCVIAAGIGLGYAAMPALIMSAVPTSETAAANGLNALSRSLGTSVSSAVIGVVLANLSIDFAGHDVPSAAGFAVALGIGGVAALLALALAALIPRRGLDRDPPITAG